MKVDGLWLRRLAYLGARHGPRSFLEHAPPLLGSGFFRALPAMRQRVIENLRLVLGERDAASERRDAERTFRNFACCLAETLALERDEARRAQLRVRVQGSGATAGSSRALERELRARRGLVVVTAHVGPFEAAAACLAREFEREVLMVMAPEPNQQARRYHDQLRHRHGVRVAHVGEHQTDALGVLSHLKAGGVAALQIDRTLGQGRVLQHRLFGSLQAVPEGPFRLAGLAQVPVISVFASRTGFFDYQLEVGEPLHISRRPDEVELFGASRRVIDDMELAISSDPTQWFHFEPSHAPQSG